jgi:hypothetical protein
MKTIIASLVALSSVFAVSCACAETPAQCILYAREYAIAAVVPAPPGSTPAHSRQSIQDAAYARCLSLGVSALVPPGTVLEDKPLVEAAPPKVVVPKVVVIKAPRRLEQTVRVPRVAAFTEAEPRPATGSVLAIAEIFGGGAAPSASLGLPVAPSCDGSSRTRFWRGLMSPVSGGC